MDNCYTLDRLVKCIVVNQSCSAFGARTLRISSASAASAADVMRSSYGIHICLRNCSGCIEHAWIFVGSGRWPCLRRCPGCQSWCSTGMICSIVDQSLPTIGTRPLGITTASTACAAGVVKTSSSGCGRRCRSLGRRSWIS